MSDSDSSCDFTFGSGIEQVLEEISIDDVDRQTFTKDAQVIENAFVSAISNYDAAFKNAFGGLSLAGSYLDDIRIDLPEEFDMNVKLRLPFKLEPICVPDEPGFVFLRMRNSKSHCCVDGGGYMNRHKLQSWLRNNIKAVMPELQNIRCSRSRVYSLRYTAPGYGVAHTIMATERRDRGRKIWFDFVPVFEFEAHQWPQDMASLPNAGRTWFAVPRKYRNAVDDSRSFIVCAPHWERLVLEKKQNLKDSLRLMKAFRNANGLHRLFSYSLKTLYLNMVLNQSKAINWNQSPGRILIRMLVVLLHCLLAGRQSFCLDPGHNNFDAIDRQTLLDYRRIVSRSLRKLIRRRNANYLTWDDLHTIFGIEI